MGRAVVDLRELFAIYKLRERSWNGTS